MREFTIAIGKYLTNGLRPDDRMQRNTSLCTVCQNARPIVAGGVSALTTFTPPLPMVSDSELDSHGIVKDFPFPQVARIAGEYYLLDKDAIYTITSGILTEVSVGDIFSPSSNGTIVGGDLWHIADMGNSFAMFNGVDVAIKTNRRSMFGADSNILVSDEITINTGSYNAGRIMFGGFDTTNSWKMLENIIRMAAGSGLGFAFPKAFGQNTIWWSQIGSGAFLLFYPDDFFGNIIEDGVFNSNDNMFLDMLERNEMGFANMDWHGLVYRILPLGNDFVVYGEDGITLMRKAGTAFGKFNIHPYGIYSRNAVINNANVEHVFVDANGWLYRLVAGEPLKRLGFREFFETMGSITISYDPIEMEYHISNGEDCYILNTSDMLYSSTYNVTSIVPYAGESHGIYLHEDDSAIIVSDVFDMGVRGIKSIERLVMTSTNPDSGVSMAVYWRMRTGDAWKLTPFVSVNNEGIAYIKVSGLEFKFVVRAEDYTTFDFDDLHVQYKTDDKRILRGIYVAENVERTSW